MSLADLSTRTADTTAQLLPASPSAGARGRTTRTP